MLKIYLIIFSLIIPLISFSRDYTSVNDTITYKIHQKKLFRIKDDTNLTVIKSKSKISTQSFIKNDVIKQFIWECKEYYFSAIENGSNIDKAVAEVLIDFPILFSVDNNGFLKVKSDTIIEKEKYLKKFLAKAEEFKLNNINDGLEQYFSSLSKDSFSEIIQYPKHPELEIFGKAFKLLHSKISYKLNDKEIFNDYIFNYTDTIKLSRKISHTIKKLNKKEIEIVYKSEVSEKELKIYLTEKYQKRWTQMKSQNIKIDFKAREEKLKTFQPRYREIIKIITPINGNEIKNIKYLKEENIELSGASLIECEILKMN